MGRIFKTYLKKNILLFLTINIFLFLCFENVGAQSLDSSGMIRVYLASIGSVPTINLKTKGIYKVNSLSNYSINDGTSVEINFDKYTGKLSLSYNEKNLNLGNSFELIRTSTSAENALYITQAYSRYNLYPCDLKFSAVKQSSSYYKLYIIANIFIEDYLKGVVPYEIGNSVNIEAIKAQTVAARTYAARAASNRQSRTYDLVDTSGDQVFKGINNIYSNCIKAVEETKGVVLQYNGQYAATYYAASNGGQTEAIKNVWNSSGYPYLKVKNDPYDKAYIGSKVRRSKIYNDFSWNISQLKTLLSNKLANNIGNIISINNITLHTPMYSEPSMLYTKATFNLSCQYNSNVSVICDIFSELEGILNLGINNSKNELWTVVKSNENFIIESRRYGHGLGLSQCGAKEMANNGFSYKEILGFYYEGTIISEMSLSPKISSSNNGEINEEIISQDDNQNTKVDEDISDESFSFAYVSTGGGKLNFRQSSTLGSAVISRIDENEKVKIIQKEALWSKIEYNGIIGFVMTQFIKEVEDGKQEDNLNNLEETANSEDNGTSTNVKIAIINTKYTGLNLRNENKISSNIITAIPKGEKIEVSEELGIWAKVAYNGFIGYVSKNYLKFFEESTQELQTNPTSASDEGDAVKAYVDTGGGYLNLRIDNYLGSHIIDQIQNGETVDVISINDNWDYVKYKDKFGFVMNKYLRIENNNLNETGTILNLETPVTQASPTIVPIVTTVPTIIPLITNEPVITEKPILVTATPKINEYSYDQTIQNCNLTAYALKGKTVKLYSQCSDEEMFFVTEVDENTKLIAKGLGEEWCEVLFYDGVLYAKIEMLIFE